jgi:hypothetical protein
MQQPADMSHNREAAGGDLYYVVQPKANKEQQDKLVMAMS